MEDMMLTRREFAEVVSCAFCAITAELMATEAAAQGTPAPTPGVTRKILSQIDGPTPGYVTILAEATIEAGVSVARHTHPGIESAWVLEGRLEVPVQGRPTLTVKAGDAFQIHPDTPHAGGKPLEAKARLIITYIVQRDKPLASPV
jgi:quercetin dioxygenase-like cupin family protein